MYQLAAPGSAKIEFRKGRFISLLFAACSRAGRPRQAYENRLAASVAAKQRLLKHLSLKLKKNAMTSILDQDLPRTEANYAALSPLSFIDRRAEVYPNRLAVVHGDLAVMYPDGYIKIKDRSKDIIISGGENISSIEVEDVLYRHPDVLAAAVVAKADAKWGETPCAFVELKASATCSEADIVAHCKKHLAGFKVPRAVVFGELPKTSTGKIQKFELRKLAGSAAAIDV